MDKYNQFVIFSFKGINTKLNKEGIEKKVPIGLPTWQQIKSTNIIKGHKGYGLICGKTCPELLSLILMILTAIIE